MWWEAEASRRLWPGIRACGSNALSRASVSGRVRGCRSVSCGSCQQQGQGGECRAEGLKGPHCAGYRNLLPAGC